ncbi:MAG TPA: hypothetical protein VF516_38705 [Kofleriaceae bacterium]
MLPSDRYAIENVLTTLGASAAADVTVAPSRGVRWTLGLEYIASLREDPGKVLAVSTSTALALVAAGATLHHPEH